MISFFSIKKSYGYFCVVHRFFPSLNYRFSSFNPGIANLPIGSFATTESGGGFVAFQVIQIFEE
jgi:hypothetical protein